MPHRFVCIIDGAFTEKKTMGNELKCTARFGDQKSAGKALLETYEIIFRGDFRLKISFSSIQSIKAADGELRIKTPDGLAVLQLGEAAEKWCDKVLHPKSRLEKLGAKPGAKASLLGSFDKEFTKQLAELTQSPPAKKPAGSDLIFFAAQSKKDLDSLAKVAKAMKGAAALWVVYPKGQKEITEMDVLAAGRKVGLKDVKVVGFSPTHTALKFVIPVASR